MELRYNTYVSKVATYKNVCIWHEFNLTTPKPIWRKSARAASAIKRELTKPRCMETVSVLKTFGCGKRQPSVRNLISIRVMVIKFAALNERRTLYVVRYVWLDTSSITSCFNLIALPGLYLSRRSGKVIIFSHFNNVYAFASARLTTTVRRERRHKPSARNKHTIAVPFN